MRLKLTDSVVKNLPCPSRHYDITWDTDVPGFGCRVTRAKTGEADGVPQYAVGAKSYVVRYRTRSRRDRTYTIGDVADWKASPAREKAKEIKRQVDDGKDPQGAKDEDREAPTVARLVERYREVHLPKKRPSSRKSDEGLIEGYILPTFKGRKVAEVTLDDVEELHRKITKRGRPFRANRVVALLSKMFSLAIKWKWRSDNPCKGLERNPEPKRKRYLKPDELKRLTEALAAYPETRAAKINRKAKNAETRIGREIERGRKAANVVRLCLLTGCRIGEALNATWAQFDLDAGKWVKPGATTKTDTEHDAPLSAAVVSLLKDILDRAPKGEDGELASEFVFPGLTPAAPMAYIKTEWAAIRKAAGIPDVRPHDLRHSFASMLASSGASLPMIGALLNHTQAQTTQRYAHLFDDPLRKLADEVGHVVTGTPSAEVVTIGGKG